MKLLSQQIPASIVFFDLLCEGDGDLRGEPFRNRRKQLESLLSSGDAADPSDSGHLRPSVASDWFRRFEGAGLDGVMAKPVAALRTRQARDAQGQARARLRLRGRRLSLAQEGRGHAGRLAAARPVRRCGRAAARRRLRQLHAAKRRNWWNFSRPIAKMRSPIIPGKLGRSMEPPAKPANACPEAKAAGARARISRGSRCVRNWSSKWPTSTCRARRFRHMSQFRRWRTDKKPSDCTYAQLEVVPPQELMEIFASGR